MTSNILIFGAKGQLGSDLASDLKGCGHQVVEIGHEVDITDARSLEDAIASELPTAVVNCAAYNNVEDAEEDPLSSYHVNAIGPYHLARITRARGIPLLHVSTDYVFDGENTQGYVEDSIPHPINAYGSSKAEGEELVRIATDAHWIVRTTGLFGLHSGGGKGYNFVTRMRELGKTGVVSVVSDQVMSPTYTNDLAIGIAKMIEQNIPFGTYHLVNEGALSWNDFAKMIFEKTRMSVEVKAIATLESGTKLRRPHYSVLHNKKLKDFGILLPPLGDALDRYLSELSIHEHQL